MFVGLLIATGDEQTFKPAYPSYLHCLPDGNSILSNSLRYMGLAGVNKIIIVAYRGAIGRIAEYIHWKHKGLNVDYEAPTGKDAPTILSAFFRGCRRATWRLNADTIFYLEPNVILGNTEGLEDVAVLADESPTGLYVDKRFIGASFQAPLIKPWLYEAAELAGPNAGVGEVFGRIAHQSISLGGPYKSYRSYADL